MANMLNHPNWSKINTFTDSIVGTISSYQDDFFVIHGRYFQGLRILGPDVEPDGTEDITTDNTSTPDDFGFSWRDFGPDIFRNNLKIPVNVEINVYESPDGWGWIVRADVWYPGLGPDEYGNDGDHWVYRHHEGPRVISGVLNEWYIQSDDPN